MYCWKHGLTGRYLYVIAGQVEAWEQDEFYVQDMGSIYGI